MQKHSIINQFTLYKKNLDQSENKKNFLYIGHISDYYESQQPKSPQTLDTSSILYLELKNFLKISFYLTRKKGQVYLFKNFQKIKSNSLLNKLKGFSTKIFFCSLFGIIVVGISFYRCGSAMETPRQLSTLPSTALFVPSYDLGLLSENTKQDIPAYTEEYSSSLFGITDLSLFGATKEDNSSFSISATIENYHSSSEVKESSSSIEETVVDYQNSNKGEDLSSFREVTVLPTANEQSSLLNGAASNAEATKPEAAKDEKKNLVGTVKLSKNFTKIRFGFRKLGAIGKGILFGYGKLIFYLYFYMPYDCVLTGLKEGGNIAIDITRAHFTPIFSNTTILKVDEVLIDVKGNEYRFRMENIKENSIDIVSGCDDWFACDELDLLDADLRRYIENYDKLLNIIRYTAENQELIRETTLRMKNSERF